MLQQLREMGSKGHEGWWRQEGGLSEGTVGTRGGGGARAGWIGDWGGVALPGFWSALWTVCPWEDELPIPILCSL